MDDNKLWKRAKARVAFKSHFRKYLYINILLWCIWLLVNINRKDLGWSFPWPLYPTAVWGIAIGIHYFTSYRNSIDDPVRREYDKLKKSTDDKLKKL